MLSLVLVATPFFWVNGGMNRAPRNADGAFEGTASRIGEDPMRLETSNGTVWVDTWTVCGDRTRQHISEGDVLVVYVDRDLFDYEAWRILDEAGEPACSE